MNSGKRSGLSDLPKPDEFEIHAFGPGYGECLLVHLGQHEWLVVDSCRQKRKALPVALTWLLERGLDPAGCVKLVVATHWHDDHVAGLGELVKACTGATFVCSAAFTSRELVTLACDAADHPADKTSGLREMAAVLQALRDRSATQEQGLSFATASKRLWQRTAPSLCEVWSLSPSDGQLQVALQRFGGFIRDAEQSKVRCAIRDDGPNHLAIALWIQVGKRVLLLGSDLEESPLGWSAVVGSTARPQDRAELFKIPHHGSVNGHNDRVWSDMLKTETLAILTPFQRGRVRLPTESDRDRILKRTAEAYITSRAGARYKPQDRVVAWALEGKDARVLPRMGHIRLRTSMNSTTPQWNLELGADAGHLSNYAV